VLSLSKKIKETYQTSENINKLFFDFFFFLREGEHEWWAEVWRCGGRGRVRERQSQAGSMPSIAPELGA